jgi:hypothetical protein
MDGGGADAGRVLRDPEGVRPVAYVEETEMSVTILRCARPESDFLRESFNGNGE